MFCTKCGKEIQAGDRFCAYCGQEVRGASTAVRHRYDDVVFNPPFKMEAEKRTEQILESQEMFSRKKEREPVQFDWDLDGYPKQNRKTEEVDFDWGSVIEKKASRPISVEKIQYEPILPVKEEPLPLTELEKELFSEVSEIGFSDTKENTIRYTPEKNDAFSFDWNTDRVKTKVENDTMLTLDEIFDISAEDDFGEASAKRDTKFDTFMQKQDAFLDLINKEKNKLNELEKSYKEDRDNLDYTWVGEVFPDRARQKDELVSFINQRGKYCGVAKPAETITVDMTKPPEPKKVSEIRKEIFAQPEKAETAEPVPEMAETVIPVHDEIKPVIEAEIETEKQEVETKDETTEIIKEEPAENVSMLPQKTEEEKLKLRYSDIFPTVGPGSVNGSHSRATEEVTKLDSMLTDVEKPADDEEKKKWDEIFSQEEEEPKRKGCIGKFILIILLILLVFEGVLFAAKLLIPNSKLSEFADKTIDKSIDLFMDAKNYISGIKNGDNANPDSDEPSIESSCIPVLIDNSDIKIKSIGEVLYGEDLLYDDIISEIPEVNSASPFTDADWYQDDNEETVTYGQVLIDTVIKYYDGWIGRNNDESLVGINKLEIGDIRIGEEGFYTLCRLTFAGADGNDVIKTQTVYLRISGNTMIIDKVKEENI